MFHMTINAAPTSTANLSPRLSDVLLFNAVWFQGLWFCTVLGRDPLLPVAGILLALHVWLSRDYRNELTQLALVGGVGIAVDAVLSSAGVFEFGNGALVPLWLCCLWLGFAAALGRSLAWLSRWRMVAAAAGGIAFPLNYWAGMRLGAVEFGYSLPVTLGLLALVWAVVLPLMFRLTARLSSTVDEASA
jgi:hypothetical protein